MLNALLGFSMQGLIMSGRNLWDAYMGPYTLCNSHDNNGHSTTIAPKAVPLEPLTTITTISTAGFGAIDFGEVIVQGYGHCCKRNCTAHIRIPDVTLGDTT